MSEEIWVGGVPEHFNAPWHMAAEQGALKGGGLEVTWRDMPGGTGQMIRALDTGELDLAVLLTEGIVRHIARGSSARIVGTFTSSPLRWGVHVAADGPIQALSELRGGRFAISRPGSGSHTMAFVLADQQGWLPQGRPRFVEVGGLEGGIEALRDGRADAFLWEKLMSKPQVDAGRWRLIGECEAPWPSFVMAASGQALGDEAKMEAIGRAIERVAAFCPTERVPDEAFRDWIEDRYRLADEDVLRWSDEATWACERAVSERALVEAVISLHRLALIDQRPGAAALVAPGCELRP